MKVTCCPGCGLHFATWSALAAKTPHRQPLVLKCGHTFCESCIIQKTRKISNPDVYHAQVICPSCKQITFLENNIKDLPVNVYLSAYIEIDQRGKLDQQFGLAFGHGLGQFVPVTKSYRSVSDNESKEAVVVKCKMCIYKTASSRCAECDTMLCIGCFEKVHSVSAAIKHHKSIPVSQSSLNIDAEQKCAEHNRILEYFCEDDSTSICSRCYIVGKHQNHHITSIEEKNKQFLEDISVELPRAKLVLQHLNKADKKIISSMPNIKNETKSLIENINHSFMRLHSLIQAREMEIISNVYSAFKAKYMSIDQQREAVEHARKELEDAVMKSKKLFENNALLLDGHSLVETLKKARTTPCIVVKSDTIDEEALMWNETHDASLIVAINTFGSISGTPSVKVHLKTLDELSETTDEDDKISIASLGSESSLPSLGGPATAAGTASSVDTGEDVIIEYEDTDVESESSRTDKDVTREDIVIPAIKGPPQKIVITHIRSPSDFCLQMLCNKRQLDTLAHNINTWCNRKGSVKHIPPVIEKDMLVIARYSADKQWYRAKVLSVDKSSLEKEEGFKVHVKYIDYGNDEQVPLKELRTMQKRFMKNPVFSFRCCLYDMAPAEEDKPWSLEAIQEFHRMTQNQVLMMTAFNMQGAVFEVDLCCIPMVDALDDSYVSVRDILIFLELARFRTFSSAAVNTNVPSSYPKVDFIKPTVVKNGTTLNVAVTAAASPYNLHLVCIGEEYEYYLNMHDEMQQLYNKDLCNIYSLFFPRLDMVCSAKGSDNEWHRAKVISQPVHKKVTVLFVDRGVTEVVHYDQLKKLHSNFIKLPVQAISCQLADVAPDGGKDAEWSDEAKLWCSTTLTNATGKARFLKQDLVTKVVLWLDDSSETQEEQSVNCLLVDMQLAVSSGPSSVKVAEVLESSPRHILNRNSDCPQKKTSSRENSEMLIDSTAQHPLLTSAPKTSKQKKKAKSPPAKKSSLPPAKSPKKQQKEDKKQSVKYHDLNPAAKTKEDKLKIQQDIHRAMTSSEASAGKDSETIYIEVFISCYLSPSEFYVQIQESQEDLVQLMQDMQVVLDNTEPSPTDSWAVNDYCAAKFAVDGLWYRGNIVRKLSEDEYEVEYVDFGNTAKVNASDLRPLLQEFASRIPCAAARCYLADLMPAGSMDVKKWSITAVEFVAGLVKNKKLYIKQEGDVTEMGLPVDLIMEEEIPETAFEPKTQSYHSVRRAIIKKGLAIATKKQSVSCSPAAPDSPGAGVCLFQRFLFMNDNKETSAEVQKEGTSEVKQKSSPTTVKAPSAPASDSSQQPVNLVPRTVEKRLVPTLSLPPYPVPRGKVKVIPTYVDAEAVIFAQPLSWEGKCAHLNRELQRLNGSTTPVVNIDWQVGQLCVAEFPDDGLWYRALIQEVKDSKVKIQYVDFGNTAWMKMNQVREMLPVFAEEHALAYQCQLHDLEPIAPTKEWPKEVLEHIHKLVVNHTCTIVVIEADDSPVLKVQLFRGEVNVVEDLTSKNLAVSPSKLKQIVDQSHLIGQVLSNQNPYHLLDLGDEGDTFRAVLVYGEFPNVVYLQRGQEVEPEDSDFVKSSLVAEINSNIQEFIVMAEKLKCCRSSPLIDLPAVGLMCAGMYSADNQLYRALCVQRFAEKDSCLLVFVDYGTAEVVERARMRVLPTEFWSIPAQAIRCHIGLSSRSESPQEMTHHMFVAVVNTLAHKDIMAKILKKNPLTVELMVNQEGEWKVPYRHLFEGSSAILKSSPTTKCKKDAAEDADLTLQALRKGNGKENWNDDSDDDDDRTLRSCEDEGGSVNQRGAGDAGSQVRGKQSASLGNASAQPGKKTIIINTGASSSDSGEDDDDDDDDDEDSVDWVAVAAKLVEAKTVDEP